MGSHQTGGTVMLALDSPTAEGSTISQRHDSEKKKARRDSKRSDGGRLMT
jgi:hypothetical protein